MKRIEYNGQVMETQNYYEGLSNEKCEELKAQYYEKPKKELVLKNLEKVCEGGLKVNHITDYYFKHLMAKVKLHHSKWSIEDLFNCHDLIKHIYAKTMSNKKIFPDTMSDIKKIETALRLCGKGTASKPTNFPIKTVDAILEKYNINNVYYDFSCGWGIRLLSAMRNNVEYLGTDPNFLLVEQLNNMVKDYNEVNKTNLKPNIKCQGSECFVKEWEGKVGLAFSSPPYFNLEDYKIGEQSYKEGTTYESWKESFLTPTIQNIHKYLIAEGVLIMNIDNFKKYNLVQDTIDICKANGFELIDTLELKNISRTLSTGGHRANNEGLYVFKKIK